MQQEKLFLLATFAVFNPKIAEGLSPHSCGLGRCFILFSLMIGSLQPVVQ